MTLLKFLGMLKQKLMITDNQLKITTNYKVDVEGSEIDLEIEQKMFQAIKKYLPANILYDDFVNGSDDKTVGIMSSSKVGPTIADDIKKNSFLAIFGL